MTENDNSSRGNSRPKLHPTFRHYPRWLIFFKNLSYQKQFKFAINIGFAQIRCSLLQFFLGKSALLYLCWMLPSISKITPDKMSLLKSRRTTLVARKEKIKWNKHVAIFLSEYCDCLRRVKSIQQHV